MAAVDFQTNGLENALDMAEGSSGGEVADGMGGRSDRRQAVGVAGVEKGFL
jgi:hypothetical protein